MEKIWKRFELAELRYCPGICLRRLNKTTYIRLPLYSPTRCHNLRDQNVRWRLWLRHWKVAGSIPDSFIELFHWHWRYHTGRTMALGVDSASNRNDYQEYLLGAGAMTDKLTTFMCRLSRNLRASNWISNRPLQGLFDLYLAYL